MSESEIQKFQRSELLEIQQNSNHAYSICLCKNANPYSIFDTFSIFKVEWNDYEQVVGAREIYNFQHKTKAFQTFKQIMTDLREKGVHVRKR